MCLYMCIVVGVCVYVGAYIYICDMYVYSCGFHVLKISCVYLCWCNALACIWYGQGAYVCDICSVHACVCMCVCICVCYLRVWKHEHVNI